MEPITVKYKVLDSRARTPAYATSGSARLCDPRLCRRRPVRRAG